MNALGQNPHIYVISPEYCQMGSLFPPYVRLGLVCMAVSYRINQTRSVGQPHPLEKAYYQHRGEIIRSLGQAIAVKGAQADDTVLAGTVSLLLCDVSRTVEDALQHDSG